MALLGLTNCTCYVDFFIFQITAFIVIPMTPNRGILVACLITGGFIFFYIISCLGQKLLSRNESNLEQNTESNRIAIQA